VLRATEMALTAGDPDLARALTVERTHTDRVPEWIALAFLVVAALLLVAGLLAADASMRTGGVLVLLTALPTLPSVAVARRAQSRS
jgi:hypothetical protein